MDAREFKQRFMPYHRLLYRVAYRLTENAQDAEDLLQDTYLKLWQKRNDLKEEAMNEAYLVTMMRNLFRDQRRLKRIDTSIELEKVAEPSEERSLDHQIDSNDEAMQMEGLIQQLQTQTTIYTSHEDMDELNMKELERISIPKGLEERLSKKIDEWEKEEKRTARHIRLPRALRYTAIAATFALIAGVGFHWYNRDQYVNPAEQDTYQDPVLAQQEAERALNLLALNLNKGMQQLEKAKALSDKTERTLNEQLKALE